MHYSGVIVGVITFLLIGLFHPIVIKAEYYFSKKIWPVFGMAGLFFVAGSLFIENVLISIILAVTGITCLWSIIDADRAVKKLN